MEKKALMAAFWRDATEQNAAGLRRYFAEDAIIRWHNTNELFDLDEYIIANCEYPGTWTGEIERLIEADADTVITVVRVHDPEDDVSVHATSFLRFSDEKIVEMDEYWGNDGQIPKWRQAKKIGHQIK
jgi:hypothetical protein